MRACKETADVTTESEMSTRTTDRKEPAMTRTHQLAVSLGAALLLAGCGTSGGTEALTAPPPPEFAAACGHPGTVVVVKQLPVVVPHATCDLTGVVVRHAGVGVTVPRSGDARVDAQGPAAATLVASVAARTGDVTIHA
jgi:hypothetical protein